jgi:hypothetical protein
MNSEQIEFITENFNIPCTTQPEEVLTQLIRELNHPINSIESWKVLLENPLSTAERRKGLLHISRIIESLKELHVLVNKYLEECSRSWEDELSDPDVAMSINSLEEFINELRTSTKSIPNWSITLQNSTNLDTQKRVLANIYQLMETVRRYCSKHIDK